jgi:nucleoside-diphosphate-sugar epimerase
MAASERSTALKFSRAIATRLMVDAILINFGLLLAFVVRYITIVINEPSLAERLILDYRDQFLSTSWLLTSLALGLLWMFGVYHHVRSYARRFKVITLLQATTLAHLAYGFSFFFLRFLPFVPRGVVVLSWVFTSALVIGIRIARNVVLAVDALERQTPKTDQPIKHVLVIGGAGYIGSLVLRRLLNQGYHVRLVDSLMYGDGAIRELYNHPQFEFVHGDMRHIETVVRSLVGMDAVIHLGAIVGDPACAIDADFSTEINLIATRMLAEACKGYGIRRFIFASTCSVYGASDELLDERSALNPVSLYAQTKIDSETILLGLADQQFAPTILRFSTIYGLSPRPRFDLVVNLLTAKAVREGKITVFGGDQWRPFVHADDAARAVVMSLNAPLAAVRGEIFNVGSDSQNYTISAIGELIGRLIPEAELVLQGSDVDKRNYRVSFAKIAKVLNFSPEHTVEDGVREIEAALRDGSIGDYYDPAYNNHKFLTNVDNAPLIRLETPWVNKRESIKQ